MLKKNLLDLKCNFFSQKKHFTSSQIRACGLGSLTTRYIIFFFFELLLYFIFIYVRAFRETQIVTVDSHRHIYISIEAFREYMYFTEYSSTYIKCCTEIMLEKTV